jgi:hypothetical protein
MKRAANLFIVALALLLGNPAQLTAASIRLTPPRATYTTVRGISGNNVFGEYLVGNEKYASIYDGSSYTTFSPPESRSPDIPLGKTVRFVFRARARRLKIGASDWSLERRLLPC